MSLVRRFLVCQSGATAVEYAVLGSFIFLAIIAAITPIAPKLGTIFNNVSTNLK